MKKLIPKIRVFFKEYHLIIIFLIVAAAFAVAIIAFALNRRNSNDYDQVSSETTASLHIESETAQSSEAVSSGEESGVHLGLDGEAHLGLESHAGEPADNPPPGNTNTQQGVTVGTEGIPVSGISLALKSLSLEYDEYTFVPYQVLPGSAGNKAVTFQSSDEAVATVNSAGLIQPKGAGNCTITVISQENSSITAILNLTVTVPPKNDQSRPEPDQNPAPNPID